MCWLLKGLAGLVVLLVVGFGVAYWLGRRLPVAHRAVASGVVAASQDRVWELITELAAQPQWRTGLNSISLLHEDDKEAENGQRCWVEWQRSMKMVLCLVEETPKTRRVVRVAGKQTMFGGTWTYELEPVGVDATKVTITEDGTVGPPLFRFLGHYVMGEETSAKQYLRDLETEALHRR